jgi:nitrogen-specific signal transduction histidine kinase
LTSALLKACFLYHFIVNGECVEEGTGSRPRIAMAAGEWRAPRPAGAEALGVNTNPGAPPEVYGRLFDPFVTAGKKDALGLGLALSRRTVRDHGGDM